MTTLESEIDALQRMLSRLQTNDIIQPICRLWRNGASFLKGHYGLSSPAVQTQFLLSLLLNTPDPKSPIHLTDSILRDVFLRVEGIYNHYGKAYVTAEENRIESSLSELEDTVIAMTAALNYFNSPKITGTYEQVFQKLELNFVPFDKVLKEQCGISASVAISIIRHIGQHSLSLGSELDIAERQVEEIKQQWLKLISFGHKREADQLYYGEYAKSTREKYKYLVEQMAPNLHGTSTEDLQKVFDEQSVEAFWKLFVAVRGSCAKTKYPNEDLTANTLPLILLHEGTAICPIHFMLPVAAVSCFDSVLRSSSISESYFQNRSKVLELQAIDVLAPLLPASSQIFPSVYETPKSNLEHDLIIIEGRNLLIIECKACSIRKPLRNPERAIIRIRDDFRSDRGIQHAFDQGQRIARRLRDGKSVNLFDKKGNPKTKLNPQDFDNIECICITAENFGYVATDLGLLELEQGDEFPWVVSILQFESFVDALLYRSWTLDSFYEYLKQRKYLYGKVKAMDELDYCGQFIIDGNLNSLINQDKVILTGQTSAIFTDIANKRQFGVDFKIDGHDFMGTYEEVFDDPLAEPARTDPGPIAWHPNRRCFCGSKRKYKNCCLRHGIAPPAKKSRQ